MCLRKPACDKNATCFLEKTDNLKYDVLTSLVSMYRTKVWKNL